MTSFRRAPLCEHKKAEQYEVTIEEYRAPLGHTAKEVVKHFRCRECRSYFGKTDWDATRALAKKGAG